MDINKLQEIEERLNKVRLGTWRIVRTCPKNGDGEFVLQYEEGEEQLGVNPTWEEVPLFSHAPEDIKWLVEEVKRLRGRLDQVYFNTPPFPDKDILVCGTKKGRPDDELRGED